MHVNAAVAIAMIDGRIAIAAKLAQLDVDDIEAAMKLGCVVDVGVIDKIGDLDNVAAMLPVWGL